MTPGSRFDVPRNLPSKDDITQEGSKFKQMKIHWIKPQADLLEETKEEKEEDGNDKKAKSEEEIGGTNQLGLPIPAHRRRAKSWRHLI